MITFHFITLFPESFDSYLKASIVGRAAKEKKIAFRFYNPRDFAVAGRKKTLTYAERRVDDRPYGGGPGMVMEALPVARAIEAAVGKKLKSKAKSTVKIVFLAPGGEQFTNKTADKLASFSDIVLICGRYEGIDSRVKKMYPMVEISVGPYVVSGGELPAMIIVDSVTRRLPGVLGDDLSVEERRIAGKDVYTRPEIVTYRGRKYRVPKVLLTGHHAKINEWKRKKRT